MRKLIIAAATALTAVAPVAAPIEARSPVPEHTGNWHLQVPIPTNGWKGYAYYTCRDRTNRAILYYKNTGHRVAVINFCANSRNTWYISDIKYYH